MSDRSWTDVAIVGMGCIFPGAGDLSTYRRNLLEGVDAITEVPPGRWEDDFYDPHSDAVDRVYANRGGFIDPWARVDPLRWGLMPRAVESAEPDQLLVLETAGRALADAGYDPGDLPGDRTGIALGRGGYMTPGIRRYAQASFHAQEVVNAVRTLVPDVDAESLERVKREYLQHLPPTAGGDVIGLVPNLAASRIANRMDLRGPAYTLDAACASSLLAVDQACGELVRRRCDLMLAGGVHVGMGPPFWSVFSQLGALSRSQRCRPFHRDADGLLIGEGVGLVVLKRLEDAERDGDRVYAVIRGSGVSSDGRATSIMNPAPDGQTLAVRRAWESAGLDPTEPEAVGMLEAHGTATNAGDAAELATLREVFGDRTGDEPLAGLGSVKSMIGHAMPAAGIAGLIKAALALHERTLLPTLHADAPHPELDATRFRLLRDAEPWDAPAAGPRRAGVNAFGFGGTNAHLVLEEALGAAGADRGPGPAAAAVALDDRPPVLLLSGPTPEALLAGLSEGRSRLDDGPCRLAVLDPTPETLERARTVVGHGKPFRDRKGHVWFTPDGELARGGRVAFVYPGLDAGPQLGIQDVARTFGRGPVPDHDSEDLEELGAGIILSAELLTHALGELGIEPDFLAGHSIGEWSAMIAAGCLPHDAVQELFHSVGTGVLDFPDVVFATVGAGATRIDPVLREVGGVNVALDNCPHQSVVCGPVREVGAVMERLRKDGILCAELPFRSGFHSPYFADFLAPVEDVLAHLELSPPRRPLWSATTCAPFPTDPTEIRELFLEHLVRPVRFRELVEKLHDAGARVFVQVGRGNLVGFIDDVLRGRGHAAVAALDPRVGGLEQLRRLSAALWVEGADVELERLMAPVGGEAGTTPDATGMAMDLTSPLGEVTTPLPVASSAPVALGEAAHDPVIAEFDATTRALDASRRAVLEAWRERQARPAPLAPRDGTFVRHITLESYPELVDHSLFPIPEGWPEPEDGFPVVPMTMSWALMLEAAEELVPERRAVAVEDVRAFRWMAVDDPLELEIHARFDGDASVEIELGEFVHGRVRMAETWPEPPAPWGERFEGEEPIDETATEMYENRLMFHGPRYRAVEELVAFAEEGVRARIIALPAAGSLLDGAGQTFGYWIRQHSTRDRLAFPVMVDDVTLHGPHPEPGTVLDCSVRVLHAGRSTVRADIEVRRTDGRVWATCRGWTDHRIENEEWMWPVIQFPNRYLLAEPVETLPGTCWLRRPIESRATRQGFARRYGGKAFFRAWDDMEESQRKIDWLAGRIAAKDAVRRWLWERGEGSIFPLEVDVSTGPRGEPRVSCARAPELHVSIAHRDGLAAAAVHEDGPVGIDLEKIEARSGGFDDVAFDAAERELLPAHDRDAWRTRFWAAKEAVAKWRGTGLEGDPRAYPVERVDGERVLCRGRWVTTLRDDDWILAWTIGEPE